MKLATALLLLALTGPALADVPDVATDCRLRNAAQCKIGDLEFVHDGPCPSDALTVRAPGKEDCSAALPRERPSARPERPERAALDDTKHPQLSNNTTSTSEYEHWLLPPLAFGGFGLALALAWWLIRAQFRRIVEDKIELTNRDLGSLVAGSIGGMWTAWQGAAWAFDRIIGYFQNADTAAPVILASVSALAVFCLLLPLTGGLLTWALLKLQDRLTRL